MISLSINFLIRKYYNLYDSIYMKSALDERRQKGKKIPKSSKHLLAIMNEYSLKQHQFNPNKPSPNKFLSKLELRMKRYYTDMYNSFIFSKK